MESHFVKDTCIIVTVVAAILCGGSALVSRAHGQAARVAPQYFARNQCGLVDMAKLPPRTYLRVDLDGNGEDEHYFATWGGVERHRYQPGTVPPTLVRDRVIYTSTSNTQYACADLQAVDVDRDGDLDLVYGTHSEIVVFENRNGRLVTNRRTPQNHPPEADVRLQFGEGDIRIVFQ